MDEFTKDEVFSIKYRLEDGINHVISLQRKSFFNTIKRNKFIVLMTFIIGTFSIINIILISRFFNVLELL